jgi:hypothetical protein
LRLHILDQFDPSSLIWWRFNSNVK